MGNMDMKSLASKYMEDRIFKASELLESVPLTALPGTVQYAVQKGGDPVKAVGILLAKTSGVKKVGYNRKTALWQVEA